MVQLLDQLQGTLAGRYEVEREIGAPGFPDAAERSGARDRFCAEHAHGGAAMTSWRGFLQSSAAALAGMALPPSATSTEVDLVPLTIADASRRIASKRLSPVELTQATLSRIELLNPKLGAFITVITPFAQVPAVSL